MEAIETSAKKLYAVTNKSWDNKHFKRI